MSEQEQKPADSSVQGQNSIIIGGKGKIGKLTVGDSFQSDDPNAVPPANTVSTGAVNRFIANAGSEVEIADAVAGRRIEIKSRADLKSSVDQVNADVDDAIAAGELTGDHAEDAKTAIKRAKEEVAKPEPDKSRLLTSLKQVSDILGEMLKSGESAQKIGKIVVKAAPYALAVAKAASVFLGIPLPI